MLKNYFKIALRNITKNKAFSIINISGLAIGMAACMLIALYVFNQESYDRFNSKADRIVRATMKYSFNGMTNEVALTGTKLLPEFERNFPEVESGVRIFRTDAIVKYQNKVFDEPKFAYADSTFFKVFSFKLIRGNIAKALSNPFSVILTSSTAKKYFGDQDAIGRVIRINNRGFSDLGWHNFTVSGIMQDCPDNSQIKFDFLASFCSLPAAKPANEEWWDADYYTYLLLRTPGAIKTLQAKIPSFMKKQNSELGFTGKDYLTFRLEPLLKVHLYSKVQGGMEPAGDYRYIIIFSLIALLILIIACVNYINITTAKATERAKEVGIRKVIGALRKQLFYQFIAESIVIVSIAFLAGLMLIEFALPLFKDFFGENLSLYSLVSPGTIAVLGVIVVSISLFGGSYPALVLSGYQPIKVLKGNFKTGHSGVSLRKGLIIFQFIVSVGLIICTLIIRQQMDYIHNKKLGFDKSNIAVLPVDETMADKIPVIKNEFLNNSNISGVTLATRTPVFINSTNHILYHNKKIIVNQIGVDKNFLRTLGVQLIAGNNFTSADTINYMTNTSNKTLSVIVNEAAVKKLNLQPDEAIGKTFVLGRENCMIKGVIKDFYFASMHVRINPLVLFPDGYLKEMMVKISGNNFSRTINYMKQKWDAQFPDHPFNLTFLKDDFNKLYASENKTQEIFYMFAVLAIALAYLGLFGLVSFSVRQRTKEIGIRKTLGAGTGNIIALLSKEYIVLVISANIIAWPVAYYAANRWLEGFAYKTAISFWLFAAVTLITFMFVIIMIGLQSLKVAKTNPVKSLKYE